MEITTKDSKSITLTKEISVDGTLVKRLSATISANGEQIVFPAGYISDMKLYKANRLDIRKIEDDFEDEAFAEQDALIKANGPTVDSSDETSTEN